MKFLIVDDEVDLCDILEMQILSEFDVEIYRSFNGVQAFKVIQEHGPFDAIISDYRMPQKNGFELFQDVRLSGSQTPFLICSADAELIKDLFKGDDLVKFISKPFLENELNDQLLALLMDHMPPEQTKSYMPVSLDLLRRVETPGVDLYIRLADDKYIKVLKENAIFDQSEFERFQRKNLTHLQIELMDYKPFFNQFRKNVFSKAEWNKADTSETQMILEEDWQLIIEANQVFGWSENLMNFAKQNIAKTLAIAKSNPQLKKVFEKLSLRESKSHLVPHSYANVFMTTRILQELGWSSESTLQKMTFASLFHDLDLNEMMFRNKLELIRKGPLAESIQQPSNYPIFHHPIKGAELMQRWSSCPADVDRIIAQHHEQFDGTGFPHKLNFQTIAPLSAVFIISEDLIYQRINHPEASLLDYLQAKEALYHRGDLKPVYQAAVKIAQEIDLSADGSIK